MTRFTLIVLLTLGIALQLRAEAAEHIGVRLAASPVPGFIEVHLVDAEPSQAVPLTLNVANVIAYQEFDSYEIGRERVPVAVLVITVLDPAAGPGKPKAHTLVVRNGDQVFGEAVSELAAAAGGSR